MASDDVNLTTPAWFAKNDPHEIWGRWRRECPVRWSQGALKTGFWSLSRYEDVRYVLANDRAHFSIQAAGGYLPMGPEHEDPETSLQARLARSGAQLAMMDGAPHRELRRYFQARFGIPSIRKLEDFIRECCHDILQELLPRKTFDFTADLAGRLPTAVIAKMMDIPREKWADLNRWTNMFSSPDDPEYMLGIPLETATFATSNILNYCAELALQRRTDPGDDLLSVLATATIDGRLLSTEELGFNGLMFFAAGHETTRASLSAGMLEMIRDPEQMERLRSMRHDAAGLARASEECVRWASPLTHTLRVVIEDVTVGKQAMKKGDWVVLWYASANRDEAVFDDANRFDVTRQQNPHLGFGLGQHFCLGTQLARLDMRIVFESVLDTLQDIELAAPPEMAGSNLFYGIKRMPIRFR